MGNDMAWLGIVGFVVALVGLAMTAAIVVTVAQIVWRRVKEK